MTPQGGTEIMMQGLQQRMPTQVWDHINLIPSVCDVRLLDPHKQNVLWQHVHVDQQCAQGIQNAEFWDQLACVVFVSHWQQEQYRKHFDLPMHKCTVIPNCVAPSDLIIRDNHAVRNITYTSTPWRGLDVLLQSVAMLNRSDFHVHVYSSTQIYGDQFHTEHDANFTHLWDQCEQMPQVTLHGYRPHTQVLHDLTQCDIWALPSCWEETFCLSALEALSAGCRVVTTGLGALPELCGAWAHMVPYDPNKEVLSLRFAQALNHELDQPRQVRSAQHAYYLNHYTWDQILPKWQQLFAYLGATI